MGENRQHILLTSHIRIVTHPLLSEQSADACINWTRRKARGRKRDVIYLKNF